MSYTLATLWTHFHVNMHCGPSTSESNMAKKKQTWREPSRYSSDEEENDAKRDHFPKDKMLVTHISRPRESFDHPVFKKLSRANNLVNSMSAEEITNKLRELGLSDKYVFVSIYMEGFYIVFFYLTSDIS